MSPRAFLSRRQRRREIYCKHPAKFDGVAIPKTRRSSSLSEGPDLDPYLCNTDALSLLKSFAPSGFCVWPALPPCCPAASSDPRRSDDWRSARISEIESSYARSGILPAS